MTAILPHDSSRVISGRQLLHLKRSACHRVRGDLSHAIPTILQAARAEDPCYCRDRNHKAWQGLELFSRCGHTVLLATIT
jgi:hypothetical protein